MSSNLYLLADAAELTGLTVETIRQRIKRNKLRGIKGNDGKIRVKLTDDEIEALKAARPFVGTPVNQPTDGPTDQSTDQAAAALAAYESHIATLKEQLDHLRTESADQRRALQTMADASATSTRALAEAQAEIARLSADRDRIQEQLHKLSKKPWWRKVIG